MSRDTKTVKASFIAPMLCKGVTELPARAAWWFEAKFDGYRCVAVKQGERITLYSRNGNVFRYPQVAEAVRRLPAKTVVIDGEIVAVDKQGRPCFEALGKSGAQ